MCINNDSPTSFKQAIVRSFENYLSNTLEAPNRSFGDLPPCPFAHAERAKGRIRFEICPISPVDLQSVKSIINDFISDKLHTSLLIIDPFSKISKDDGINIGTILCEAFCKRGHFAACIHPDDPFQVDGFRTREPAPHMAILVQSRSLLDWGRSILRQTNYYENWSEDNFDYISYQIGP